MNINIRPKGEPNVGPAVTKETLRRMVVAPATDYVPTLRNKRDVSVLEASLRPNARVKTKRKTSRQTCGSSSLRFVITFFRAIRGPAHSPASLMNPNPANAFGLRVFHPNTHPPIPGKTGWTTNLHTRSPALIPHPYRRRI
ncbi:V-type proton ATPase 116 kDa subunit a isoform [Anopheles sinensis]|uniref:V-type proton ATPase 116 kDa subunit a isoform n=1 Tax=Anopheles sinensis TaxID=74873 RepID=A0A084WN70_ANOSI|nr:V-type proton ATPase 116 kDa subunit a isoform [Anopheles sinensis]